jgi:hypothetical protein
VFLRSCHGGLRSVLSPHRYDFRRSQSTPGPTTEGLPTLDLGDIGFVSANEATLSGTKTSGVLTVTDGTQTAHVNLTGDYRSNTFVASADAKGGVDIVATGAQTP